ncbi:MAG TPA: nucleotide disphospho-sugar-binding domain-containing protein [Actinocrinis sp.]|nr:nucleotide disphospho-sugar-binding domain-containing protein [Actinocrinis sp.]
MKVLAVTWGLPSHLYTLVPVAWALRSAGHEVRFAGPPGLVEAIAQAGLPAVPVGPHLDFATVAHGQIGRDATGTGADDADGPQPAITKGGTSHQYAEAMLPDLVDFGRHYGPDLILHDPGNLAAAVAAAVLRVPSARMLWGPDYRTRLGFDADTVLGPLVDQFGLDPAEVPVQGALTLDPCPPPMQVPLSGPHRPIRFVPYNGAAILPGWLRTAPARPLVYLTRGTMMGLMCLDGDFDLVGAVRAVAELDVDLVLASIGRDLTGVPLPSNVRVSTDWLALHLALPSCAVLVHQGGAGTTMTGAAYGVPQLILPSVADQHFNAERLAVTGAGTSLPTEQAGPEAVRDAVAALIGDARWKTAATVLRRRNDARPTPAEVVTHLEQLAHPAGAAATSRPPTRRLEASS